MVIITLINYSNSTASFCILSCFRKGSKVKTPLMQIRFFRILSIPTISVLHRASQDSSYERKDLCSFLPETCPSVVLDVERETRSKKKRDLIFLISVNAIKTSRYTEKNIFTSQLILWTLVWRCLSKDGETSHKIYQENGWKEITK